MRWEKQERGVDMSGSWKKRLCGIICMVVLLFGTVSLNGIEAMAAIRHLTINVDTENIEEWTPGIAFLPPLEIDDVDEDILTLQVDESDLAAANPTQPYAVRFTLQAQDSLLDDELEIHGTGIRASYVDSVSTDYTEAKGRMQIYPFYQLTAPLNLRIDEGAGKLYWEEVPYAGKYEILIGWDSKSGHQRTEHRTCEKNELDISGYLSAAADGSLGIAVRALATKEEGFVNAWLSEDNVTARWDSISFAEKYRLRITWIDNEGKKQKHEETVSGTSKNVAAYVNSSAKHNVRVTVRAIPGKNDAAYYNIALSEFSYVGTGSVDVSDYQVDDPWEMLSEYQAVVDGNFASAFNANNYSYSGSPANGNTGQWSRVGYRWQYLLDGRICSEGWQQIGGAWYYFDHDGFMRTGWLLDQGKWYYLEPAVGASCGVMLTGTQNIGGVVYEFDGSGACINPPLW